MSLPRIEHPLFDVKIPSTKKNIKMRPMLVKEEKILLMAKESQENNSIILAVKQIVNNCIANHDINVDDLTIFDVDYLFVQLRAHSIDNKIKITFTDGEDEPDKKGKLKQYEFDVDLYDVTVKFPDKESLNIAIDKTSGIKLHYPKASTYESEIMGKTDNAEKIIEELIINSFDSYYTGKDQVYSFKDATREEIVDFIDNLDIQTYNKIVTFFEEMPKLYYEIKYKNTKGTEQTLILKKLNDFFIF
jgi:hypothetical protein